MLSLAPGVRLFVATAPTDVRKSFNGLSDLVVGSLGMDPMAGDIFIFLNRRGDQMRMLFWDTDGSNTTSAATRPPRPQPGSTLSTKQYAVTPSCSAGIPAHATCP